MRRAICVNDGLSLARDPLQHFFIPRCAPLLGDLVPDAAHTGSGDWCVLRGAAIATPPACCVCRVPCARGVLSGSSLPLTIALALASQRRRSHSASKRTAAHCRWGHEAERPINLLNIGGPARVLQKRHRIFFLSPCGAITSTVDRSSFVPFSESIACKRTCFEVALVGSIALRSAASLRLIVHDARAGSVARARSYHLRPRLRQGARPPPNCVFHFIFSPI